MFYIVFGLMLVPFHYALWKLFIKAGRKGWESLVPFYDIYVMTKITGRPWWWTILFLFPGINLIMFGAILLALAKAFGKYKSSEHWQAIFLFFYFFPKIAAEKDLKYVPRDKQPKPKKSVAREWGEAIIFAIVAATLIKGYIIEPYKIPTSSMEEDLLVGDFLFVSKVNYGTRIPNTPLTFPFTHNSFYDLPGPIWPFKKSYLNWWELPYMRLPGFQKIKRNDIVVFNFPANDTTINTLEYAAHNYYTFIYGGAQSMMNEDRILNRPVQKWEYYVSASRRNILSKLPVIEHPVDKRSNYIKRCVGVPGDKLEVREGILYINDEPGFQPPHMQYSYDIKLNSEISATDIGALQKMGVTREDRGMPGTSHSPAPHDPNFNMNWVLSKEQAEYVSKLSQVDTMKIALDPKGEFDGTIYPNDPRFPWNKDNFGPITVPKKGSTVELNVDNLPLYQRIITAYEHHKLEVKDGQVYIDGKIATSYTFGMNYYFMMGDNRHGSADSRFWGYVPYDHVVGKGSMVIMSSGENGIRWNRAFKLVH